jgi:hypothetical protein
MSVGRSYRETSALVSGRFLALHAAPSFLDHPSFYHTHSSILQSAVVQFLFNTTEQALPFEQNQPHDDHVTRLSADDYNLQTLFSAKPRDNKAISTEGGRLKFDQ